ncbi:hypothetical protein ACS0TY_024232 [Phlomoides rotata]
MSSGAAGDGLLRGVFESCISGKDLGIKRRPYHKNCKCALHKARGHCTHTSRSNNVSYPIRRSWSEGCLALMNNSSSTATSGVTSPLQSSPTIAAAPPQEDMTRAHTHLVLCTEQQGGDQDSVFYKV